MSPRPWLTARVAFRDLLPLLEERCVLARIGGACSKNLDDKKGREAFQRAFKALEWLGRWAKEMRQAQESLCGSSGG